ncbi:MAG: hypothetical protein ACHQET_12480 [Chitinophagales bacterium]
MKTLSYMALGTLLTISTLAYAGHKPKAQKKQAIPVCMAPCCKDHCSKPCADANPTCVKLNGAPVKK